MDGRYAVHEGLILEKWDKSSIFAEKFNQILLIMKRFFVAALAVALVAFQSFAQTEPGTFTIQPTAGINFAKTTGECSMKTGFTGGVDFGYKFTNVFGVSVGAMYASEGFKVKDSDNNKFNADYINVPVMVNFNVVAGLVLKAGIQPGFNIAASATGMTGEGNLKELMKPTNLSIPVGIAYEFGNFVIDARYNIGVTPMFKIEDYLGEKSARGSVIQVTLGYKFAL